MDLLGEWMFPLDLLRCVHTVAILTAVQLYSSMSDYLTSCWYRLSKMLEVFLRDSGPGLHDSIALSLLTWHLLFHQTPKVLYWDWHLLTVKAIGAQWAHDRVQGTILRLFEICNMVRSPADSAIRGQITSVRHKGLDIRLHWRYMARCIHHFMLITLKSDHPNADDRDLRHETSFSHIENLLIMTWPFSVGIENLKKNTVCLQAGKQWQLPI